MKARIIFCIFGFLFSGIAAHMVQAQEFQSTDYKALDPVIFPANYSTSTNFSLHSTISQVAISTSTGGTFQIRSGFLYFPFVAKPVASATAGNAEVSLSWTAASASLGWSVSGYDVGQSTVSGGPYSYSAVGNVLSSTRTGLTNGTTYYFVVLVKDAYGNRIATSTQVSSVPSASATPPPPPPGGGSGGGAPLGTSVPPIVIIPPLKEPPVTEACKKVIADINCDGKVNLVDFSIMYYWFEKQPVPPRVDLNRDGKVNIFDFSIMAYHWTN